MSSFCACCEVPRAHARMDSVLSWVSGTRRGPWTAPPRDWGDCCVYIYKHIPDQIINSNSLGGEISRHLTFLSVSLLYFLMFLFWIVISVVETWCYLDRCSVWWLWHGNQFPLDQSGGWFWFHVAQEQPAGGLTAWHLFLTPGSDSQQPGPGSDSRGSWRLASLQWGASRCSSRWSSVRVFMPWSSVEFMSIFS